MTQKETELNGVFTPDTIVRIYTFPLHNPDDKSVYFEGSFAKVLRNPFMGAKWLKDVFAGNIEGYSGEVIA